MHLRIIFTLIVWNFELLETPKGLSSFAVLGTRSPLILSSLRSANGVFVNEQTLRSATHNNAACGFEKQRRPNISFVWDDCIRLG